MALKIAPSILSADFGNLAQEIQAVDRAGADEIHVDVMDGRFVPNITIGPLVVEAARRATELPLDVHLMILDPDRYVEQFIRAGADWLVVHLEACTHLDRCLAEIRRLGARPGVSLNPSTPPESLAYVLDKVDRILVMSVNPGFGGQAFIPSSLAKLTALKEMIAGSGRSIDLEVDGGVNPETVGSVVAAGADTVVAGSAVFGAGDYAGAIASLRRAAQAGD